LHIEPLLAPLGYDKATGHLIRGAFDLDEWEFRPRRLGHDLGQKHRLEHQPGQFRVGPRTVPPAGLEPATGGLENRCSILLSYGGLDRHLSDEAQA
jgi:hypothetical protein